MLIANRETLSIIKMNILQKSILFFVLIISYFYFFISSSGINCSNDGSHMALALSLKNEQSVVIEKYASIFDLEPDYAVKDSKIYSDRLPGNAFLINIILEYSDLFKWHLIKSFNDSTNYQIVSAILLPNLCGTLGMLILFLTFFRVFKLSFTISIILMLIGGFCTLNAQESIHLFSHAPSLLIITFAVYYCFIKRDHLKKRDLYLLVTLIGFSSCLELQNILFLAPIMIYFLSFGPNSNSFKIVVNKWSMVISLLIILFFTTCLITYNYCAFGEIILKSNKYNPFFPEEKSFFTSLSGNPLIGLDNLFTSFRNLGSNWHWYRAVRNDTPGLFSSSPIYIFSCLGFIPLFKNNKKDALLLISIIMISVLIAAFHKTTLVRHISSIYLLLFIPIACFIKQAIGMKRERFWVSIFFIVFISVSIYSFLKIMYLTNHYWGRYFTFFEFPYLKYTYSFFILNFPFLLLIIRPILIDTKMITKAKNALKRIFA